MMVSMMVLMSLAASCGRFSSDEELRAKKLGADGKVKIAVVWDSDSKDGFLRGAELAKDEIATKGGVLGRTIQLDVQNDKGNTTTGKAVAQSISEDAEVALVLGHLDAQVAALTSVMYEYAGALMVFPGSGTRRITRPGFSLVFRALPSAEAFGGYLADYAAAQRVGRVLVAYSNDDYGRAMANSFESRAEETRIRIVDRLPFEGSAKAFERSVRALVEDKAQVDRILVAAKMPEARVLVETLRAGGMEAPIMSGDGMDSSEVLSIPGLEGATIASVYHPAAQDAEAAGFTQRYRAKFGEDPDTCAALAYDSLMVFANAAQVAGALTPKAIALALRSSAKFVGVTGPLGFDERGDRIAVRLVFKKVKAGKFELEAAAPKVDAESPKPEPATP
ncbi:MAG: ABC transporter substrate-binding protein [Deltaproteobacteria bacterium]|nr:ABC transporter substrate-binding protein [Deltaproteobacteria bacterium]